MIAVNVTNYIKLLFLVSLYVCMTFSLLLAAETNIPVNSKAVSGFPGHCSLEPTLDEIMEIYQGLQYRVETGGLSLEMGAQAQGVWVGLQKYRAFSSEKIKSLETQIMNDDTKIRLRAARELARHAVENAYVHSCVFTDLQKIGDEGG